MERNSSPEPVLSLKPEDIECFVGDDQLSIQVGQGDPLEDFADHLRGLWEHRK